MTGAAPVDDDEAISDEAAALEAARDLVDVVWAGHAAGRGTRARPGSASCVAASTSSARSIRSPSTSTRRSRRRLESLETQAADLRTAIVRTRGT